MRNKPLKTHCFRVTENNHSMDVVVPLSDDRSYDKYLIESSREKTKDELRKMPARVEKPGARENLAGLLKEKQEFDRRKQQSVNRRYY